MFLPNPFKGIENPQGEKKQHFLRKDTENEGEFLNGGVSMESVLS